MDIFSLFVIFVCLCQYKMSVCCNLVVTRWRRADLLALLNVMVSCVFVNFLFGVLGQV